VVKIIDFGISKFAQGEFDKWRTKTGSVMGTPAYMSPEQARGSAGLDHRTDIYSMGTILFEMLTGALPFAGSNFAEYLSAMLIDDPRAPQSVCAGFPAEAEPLVRKALAKNPDQRFQNAAEMLEALTALPSFDARQERLTLLASTIEIRGFAAGDLGQALSAPGRLADNKPVSSRFRGAATAVLGAGPWRWVILGVALAAGAAAAVLWSSKSSRAPAPNAPITAQPAPIVPVAPPPASSPPSPPAALPVSPPAPPSEPAPSPRAEGAPASDEAAASEKKTKKRPRPATTDVPAAVEPTAGKRVDKKLRKGTRGTEMSEDFE
jgi:serine/threonine-protein kinase